MRTRKEAVEFISQQFKGGGNEEAIPDRSEELVRVYGHRMPNTKIRAHYGAVEIRHLLDFLYGGPPQKKDEEFQR